VARFPRASYTSPKRQRGVAAPPRWRLGLVWGSSKCCHGTRPGPNQDSILTPFPKIGTYPLPRVALKRLKGPDMRRVHRSDFPPALNIHSGLADEENGGKCLALFSRRMSCPHCASFSVCAMTTTGLDVGLRVVDFAKRRGNPKKSGNSLKKHSSWPCVYHSAR